MNKIEHKTPSQIVKNIKSNDNRKIIVSKPHSYQNIVETEIICQNCNKVNKSTSYNNIFFICFDCKKNLCRIQKMMQ